MPPTWTVVSGDIGSAGVPFFYACLAFSATSLRPRMTTVKGEAVRPLSFFAERASASIVDPIHRPELSGQTLVDFLDSELLDRRHDTLEVGTIGLE